MKKILPVLFGLLCMPAFAEVAPVYYESETDVVESPFYDENPEEVSAPATAPILRQPALNARTPVTARSATRAVPAAGAQTAPRAAATSRAVASRNAATSIRSMSLTGPEKTLATRSSGTNNVNTARAGIVQSDTVTAPLYNARVGVRGSAIGQLSATRMAGTPLFGSSPATPVDTGVSMEEIAQLEDFCKAQFFACMDNFCDVLDDNQGRCSCSANIANYKKSEDALKQATEDLQDVAMKIQYLGLTKDEVNSLFTQTEAEQEMQRTQDTSQLKNDLDKIKKLVLDVKGGSSTGFENGFLDFASLDLNFGSGFDLSSLFGMGSSTISNQRGAELFKTASTRCKASVLDTCKKQGVDTALITNSYDLEIDRQCIEYERALDDSNTQMRRTVRNATAVLQKARLVVAQNRNSYDMRGCVSALDACMQNDSVCGNDYELCLDPTGKFIVNGEVIPGSDFTAPGFTSMWGVWGNSGSLSEFISSNITNFNSNSANMVSFLVSKIGRNENGRDYGMCMSVLNRCQAYTYSTGANKRYDPQNQVVKEYLTQALTQIKARQDNIIAEYRAGCKSDVQSCLITNGAIIGSSGTDIGYVSNAVYNACLSVIKSCATTLGIGKESLVVDIACYTAGEGSAEPPYNAWSVPGTASTAFGCNCPIRSTWSMATKTCNCPKNSTWSYETGECECAVGYEWGGTNPATVGGKICCPSATPFWDTVSGACIP
ncbi:MAG: hypothetical protein FWE50_00830 [Alphaproteobacteria bacterium]|nr:hypothetical protein [Alphaproteobacteria bacterium]